MLEGTPIRPGATSMAAVDAIMALYGRENIELAIETLIERLDQRDGDADHEDSDPDLEPDGTDDGDPAWNEWHTRGRHKLLHGGEPVLRTRWGGIVSEDAEDDDPAEDDGEDRCTAGDDGCAYVLAGHWSGWGALHDDADREAWFQPPVTPYAAGNEL